MNLVDPDQHGATHLMRLTFPGMSPNARVTVQRVDDEHGNVLPRYAAMGRPVDPTPAQVEQLNRETALPAPEETHLHDGYLDLKLTPNTLALIEVVSQ